MAKYDTELCILVAKAYLTFPEQKFLTPLRVCRCNVCVSDDDEFELRTTPRGALSARLIKRYLVSADFYEETLKGAEYRHFLPRMFELFAQDKICHCATLFERLGPPTEGLGGADYRRNWRDHEIELIDDFFRVAFQRKLATRPTFFRRDGTNEILPDDRPSLDDFLCAFAYAGHDLAPILNLWSNDTSFASLLHLVATITRRTPRSWLSWLEKTEGGWMRLPFWQKHLAQDRQIASWLADQRQITRLEAAARDASDETTRELIECARDAAAKWRC